MSTYQRITFRNEHGDNSDDASYQNVLPLKFKDFQGPTKENFKDFQGLEQGLLKFKGFQGFSRIVPTLFMYL